MQCGMIATVLHKFWANWKLRQCIRAAPTRMALRLKTIANGGGSYIRANDIGARGRRHPKGSGYGMNDGSSIVKTKRAAAVAAVVLVAFAAGACGLTPDPVKEEKPRETIFGEGGLFGGDNKKGVSGDQGGVIGVNSYLWRAALDTITFMPVASADPFGGVIITDWHAPDASPNERFKMNIYILGRSLRADGVRVAVFRQLRDAAGWRDAPITPGANTKIEDAILMRARQIRNQTAGAR